MKAVVFDFDGVLADSFDVLYGLNREAMSLVGIDLSQEQYRDLFGSNIHSGFRKFISGDESYKKFISFKKENFGIRYQEVKLFPGIPDILRRLSDQYILAISSSTLKEFIDKLLIKNELNGNFKFIVGNQDHSKEKGLEEIKNKLECNFPDMAMVSDTTADLAVAKQLGMVTVAAGWGFHNTARLSASGPDIVVDTPANLIKSLTFI